MFDIFFSLVVEDEDLKIIRLCKAGDLDSFEILVKKYQRDIINLAYRIVENFEASCDIAQEAFFSAYKKIKSFKEEARFSTYLYKITLNLSRNYLKKMKREKIFKKEQIQSLDQNLEIKSNDPLPLEELEKEELKKKVIKTLNLLERDLKEIIILRDMDGLSYEEIGHILGIPLGTVKSRVARARQKFIELLKGAN